VLIPQALGADQFLRVTWHEGRRVIVFSHWEGDHCVAATPVRIDDIGELAELTVSALANSIAGPAEPELAQWAAPHPDDLILTTPLARPA
jgi:hypothetical protein